MIFTLIETCAIIFTSNILMIGVEKIVGWALSNQFMHQSEVSVKDAKLMISSER